MGSGGSVCSGVYSEFYPGHRQGQLREEEGLISLGKICRQSPTLRTSSVLHH